MDFLGIVLATIAVCGMGFFVVYVMSWGEENRDVERVLMTTPKEDIHRVRNWRDKAMINMDKDKELYDKLIKEDDYYRKLVARMNNRINTIPGLEGLQVTIPKHREDYYDKRRKFVLIKMIHLLNAGKVPSEWGAGWIFTHAITNLMNREMSNEEIIVFFKWYETELKKAGYTDANLVAKVLPNGFPVEWYFAETTTANGLRKMW